MSVGEFFNMGGYALYVWGSFGVALLLMVVEPFMLRSRRRSILRRISRIIRAKSEVRNES